jgi:hypothetical protein
LRQTISVYQHVKNFSQRISPVGQFQQKRARVVQKVIPLLFAGARELELAVGVGPVQT